MSSQLHEAVQLAQSGSRDEARGLLRQIVQSDSNNEVAWLWLASVAADQTEYVRALDQVLRINPQNQQARQLKDQFQQQYAQPQAAPPQYGTPPPQPAPQYYAPPAQQPYYAPPGQPYPGAYAPAQKPKSSASGCGCGGCGCLKACFLLIIVFIILPTLACGVLSYSSRSLGPFDVAAVVFPGELGRKTVSFELAGPGTPTIVTPTRQATIYEVSISVPRSWYPAIAGDDMWKVWRDGLNEGLKFQDSTQTWTDLEVDLSTLTLQEGGVAIVDVNPITLATGGAPNLVTFLGTMGATDLDIGADFTCATVRAALPSLGSDPNARVEIVEAGGGLCGVRVDSTDSITERFFKDFDAPKEMHTTFFIVPMDQTTGSAWMMMMSETLYDWSKGHIAAMIESVKIEAR